VTKLLPILNFKKFNLDFKVASDARKQSIYAEKVQSTKKNSNKEEEIIKHEV